MSYRTNSRTGSENGDDRNGNYLADGVRDDDTEQLSPASPFLEEGLEAAELPDGALKDSLADSGGERFTGEELPGLSFALSERLDLPKARIDTLLKEAANRRRLHRTVQQGV